MGQPEYPFDSLCSAESAECLSCLLQTDRASRDRSAEVSLLAKSVDIGFERGTLCERCLLAQSHVTRARGLLGRSDLPRGEGMLFPRTSSIHMFFMRFPIDVVFADRDLRVLKI